MLLQEKVSELEANLDSSREEETSRVAEVEAKLVAVAGELEGAKAIAGQAAELAQQGAELTALLEAAERKAEGFEGQLQETEGLRAGLQVRRYSPGLNLPSFPHQTLLFPQRDCLSA